MPTTVLSDDFFVPTPVARICAGTRAPGREPTSDMTVAESMVHEFMQRQSFQNDSKMYGSLFDDKNGTRCVSLWTGN